MNPVIPNTKRVERTSITYNNFISSIQDRVHIIISLESGNKSQFLKNKSTKNLDKLP